MRGAFYVTTALLIANSIRTAAEANRSEFRQTPYHVGLALGIMDTTKSSPRRFLEDGREHHDDSVVSAADEERMPEASSSIIENAVTSSSQEALSAMRKAAHLTMDLNASPKETALGALEAYHILQSKNTQTYSASNLEVSRSHVSNKRTAQALTSPDKASGSAIPNTLPDGQHKKLRTGARSKARQVQSSISRDSMTLKPRTLNDNDVQNVHNLYLKYLTRNSAGFKPTEDETRKMLGQVNRARNANPILANTYTQYVTDLMEMDLGGLKKLGLNSDTILKPSLRTLLERTSEDIKEIQICLLRLLCLRRWMRMNRDFFYFCLQNHEICSNFRTTSTLQKALQRKDKFAGFSVEVVPSFAVLGTKMTRITTMEKVMFRDLMAAVKNANLEEADSKFVYTTLEEVSRDDCQLVASGRQAFTADTRKDRQRYDVLKTPPSSGTNEVLFQGGQGKGTRDRKKILELVDEATNRAIKVGIYYNEFAVKDNERVIVTRIFEAFKKDSEPEFAPTPEMIKKMWRMFNWKKDSSDPRKFKYAGRSFLDYVCRLDQMELETVLGSKRVDSMRATQHMEEGDANYLHELRTEYLMDLLETYDKFYPFRERHRSLCEFKEQLFDHPEPSQ